MPNSKLYFPKRLLLTGLLLFLQFFLFLLILLFSSQIAAFLYFFLRTVGIFTALGLTVSSARLSCKPAWITAILLFPIAGGIFFLFWGHASPNLQFQRRLEQSWRPPQAPQAEQTLTRLQKEAPSLGKLASYIQNVSDCPVWENSSSEYFPLGEDFASSLLQALEQAEKFILIEYFIFEQGKLWDAVLKQLVQAAARGVLVFLIYDDMGCIQTMPPGYFSSLENQGIQTAAFNPFTPQASLHHNYRDHRKICVMDGKIGYTGGLNIGDAYINLYPKHGHWKDTALKLKGEAVRSLTALFAQHWQCSKGVSLPVSCFSFENDLQMKQRDLEMIQPFGDGPYHFPHITQNVYRQIANLTVYRLYIVTPYLILDDDTLSSFSSLALSGADVRILTPGVADKLPVHLVTRSHYRSLLENGVSIYEYTPGFVHAKMMISDGRTAILGTSNLDYRSLFLHFENSVVLYGGQTVTHMEQDLELCFQQSRRITLEEVRSWPLFTRIAQAVLKLFSPLM